jgi:hypothetical protein
VARQRETPLALLGDYSHGLVRDAPRGSIPQNGVYDAHDFLLHEVGVAIKRGGTSYAGPAMTAATYAAAVVYAEFPAGAKLVGIGENGHAYTVTAGTTTDIATLGAGFPPVDVPKLRIGGSKNLLIIPGSDGTTVPKVYNGTTIATLGGTPAAGKFAAVHKTRIVLANTAANPNRMRFSPTPDPETTWDATSYLDADYPISGLVSLQNGLLVFSQGHLELFLGSTPPPGTDMSHGATYSTGCTDARSIAVQDGNVIFANPRGVYLTNGGAPVSLTEEGLISTYWQALMAGYDPATWVIAGGLLAGRFYLVSILDASGALVATLMCNVARRAWWPLLNVRAMMFSVAVGAQEELYYADRATNRVTKLAGILSPAAGNKNDADGTPVAPFLETRLLGGTSTLKVFGNGQVSYDMRDAASDNPTLAMAVAVGMLASSFTAVAESPLAETTDLRRAPITVAQVSQGVTLRFTQSGASEKTELYAVEIEQRALPPQHGGQ